MSIKHLLLTCIVFLSLGGSLALVRPKAFGTIPQGVTVNGVHVGGRTLNEAKALLTKRVKAQSMGTITIKVGEKIRIIKTAEIGLTHDLLSPLKELGAVLGGRYTLWRRHTMRKWAAQGRYRFFSSVSYDREAIGRLFREMKREMEILPKSARLDMIKRVVVPSRDGLSMDLSTSIARFEKALQSGKTEVVAKLDRIEPKISSRSLKNLSLKSVLGWYETSFAEWGKWKNRAHNLKVGGAKLTGTIILPGKDFSFNETLGPRSAKMGYRVAPIIALGETVDGMGGGMCQIASTMFAAAFFAGLDFPNAKQHSQPSHYIDLALDATVFYPSVDLVLHNPYNFPVALRIDVSGGRVRVEILGKERPYSTIIFIRRVVTELPFKTAFRQDKELLMGTSKLDQRGQKGYVVRRRRIFMDEKGYEIKAQTWTITYPSTTMIIKKGTKKPEDPNFVPPEQEPFKPTGDPPAYRKEAQ